MNQFRRQFTGSMIARVSPIFGAMALQSNRGPIAGRDMGGEDGQAPVRTYEGQVYAQGPEGPIEVVPVENPDGSVVYMTPNGHQVLPQNVGACDGFQGGSYPGQVSSHCDTGYDRSLAPENLLADGVGIPALYIGDKARSLPPWLTDSKKCEMQRMFEDYTQVGTVGQARAAIETLFALGNFGNVTVQGVVAGNDLVITIPNASVKASIGFVLDWGVTLVNYSPFDIVLTTTGASASGFQLTPNDANPAVANRSFTVRAKQVPGGRIFVPWAVRVAPGMSIAQQVIAGPTAAADVVITINNVPAAILAQMNAQATLLTAFHPLTAAFAAAIGAYSAQPGLAGG